MELTSAYFKDLSELVSEKNILVRQDDDRDRRESIIRNFYNGQPTMTQEEKDRTGREEITNHLLGHKAIAKMEGRFYSVYSAPGNIIDIKADTDSPEEDSITSVEISKTMTKAIRHSNKLSYLWRSLSGELNLSGRSPFLFESKVGWCPVFVPRVLLPEGTPIISRGIPYAFIPKEMSMSDLRQLESAAKKPGSGINAEAVQALITKLETQIQGNSKTEGGTTMSSTTGFQKPVGVTKEDETVSGGSSKATVDVWWYYEPTPNDSGDTPVSGTLFSENLQCASGEGDSLNSMIIVHQEEALPSPEAWLHLMCLDSEIGGVKTYDTTKGIAQLSYASDLDAEEMLNIIIEGDKARALPRFQKDDTFDEQDILDWDPNMDSTVPRGIKEFRLQGSTQHLMAPMGLLMNNSAGITADSHSNVGKDQQLRVQALQSQALAAEAEAQRMADLYMSADSLMEEIANRFFNSDNSDKTAPDYHDIAWFREQMTKKGIDYKALGKKSHGRFDHLIVKCRRLNGNGQADQAASAAQFMMSNLSAFPPEARPLVMRNAVTWITQDTDFAEELVKLPNMVINQQKPVAENEIDTIFRRASLGRTLPINPDDIDQDHIPVHLVDLEAAIVSDQYEPWTPLFAEGFRLAVEHVNLHIERMLATPQSNKEADPLAAILRQLTSAGDQIINRIQQQAEQEQQQGQPLTSAEQAKFSIEQNRLDLEAQKFGAKLSDQEGVERQRQSRTQIAERNQLMKEEVARQSLARQDREEFREVTQ